MLYTAPTESTETQPGAGRVHPSDNADATAGRSARVNGQTLSQPRPAGAPADSKDVLVVEDEPYLCDLIADVLEAEGHTTRKASNGLDALELISVRKPHLVFLDLMMPVMDGWEFMTELRANPAWRDIPVVIITAVYDMSRADSLNGASAIITKPFDIDQLSDVVRRYAN